MTVVMTMSVENLAVAKSISSPLAFWHNMVDFPDISVLEDQSTEAAFPLLVFEELGQLPFHQRVVLESVTPIQKLSVIGASLTSYLDMVADRCLAV